MNRRSWCLVSSGALLLASFVAPACGSSDQKRRAPAYTTGGDGGAPSAGQAGALSVGEGGVPSMGGLPEPNGGTPPGGSPAGGEPSSSGAPSEGGAAGTPEMTGGAGGAE